MPSHIRKRSLGAARGYNTISMASTRLVSQVAVIRLMAKPQHALAEGLDGWYGWRLKEKRVEMAHCSIDLARSHGQTRVIQLSSQCWGSGRGFLGAPGSSPLQKPRESVAFPGTPQVETEN